MLAAIERKVDIEWHARGQNQRHGIDKHQTGEGAIAFTRGISIGHNPILIGCLTGRITDLKLHTPRMQVDRKFG